MRYSTVILLLMLFGNSYSQESYFESIIAPVMKQFAKNSTQIDSCEQLPSFIRNPFDQSHKDEFAATYIAVSGNDYMIVCDHGEYAGHFHTTVFKTNGKKIKNSYDFILPVNMYLPDNVTRSKIQGIISGFVQNSQRFTSFKMLPQYIVNYIEERNGQKFNISGGSGPRRKLIFIAKLNDNYILSYDHGGYAHHPHAIVFETNGKEVTNVYNIITFEPMKNVTELMNIVGVRWYWLRNEHL
jgi:hypothetical protein